MYTGFWWGNQWKRSHLEDPDVAGEDNIKMDVQEVGCEGMDCIAMARWRAILNVVINLLVP